MSPDPVFAAHYAEQSETAVARMQQIEDLVRRLVPDVTPSISYGIPTFKLEGRNFVHWAGWPHHVGFYPGAATIERFTAEFGARIYARGSVQFPHADPLPLDLIERMVRFRLTV